jgi:hypothetical protein
LLVALAVKQSALTPDYRQQRRTLLAYEISAPQLSQQRTLLLVLIVAAQS